MDEQESEYRRIARIRIRNVVIAVLAAIVIGVPGFLYFSISTQAHTALREAKNIKLATNMLSVEFYGTGQTLYDPSWPEGMNPSVRDRLLEVTQNRGDLRLLGYDSEKREVTAFVYETGHIKVTYARTGDDNERWVVDYIFRYAEYDSDENNVKR